MPLLAIRFIREFCDIFNNLFDKIGHLSAAVVGYDWCVLLLLPLLLMNNNREYNCIATEKLTMKCLLTNRVKSFLNGNGQFMIRNSRISAISRSLTSWLPKIEYGDKILIKNWKDIYI